MLNKPVWMRFIIADTTALLHMERGDFVLPAPFIWGILSRGIMSGGLCPGGILSVSRLHVQSFIANRRNSSATVVHFG